MDHFCYLFFVFVMLSCLFIAAMWPSGGKGLTFWLSFAMFYCVLSLSHGVSWVRCGTRLYRFLILAIFSYFVTSYYGIGSLKSLRELNIFMLHQQQNLDRTFGTSKMHLSPLPFG